MVLQNKTTGIKSETEAFDKSRFIMTFLTILRVTELYYAFSSEKQEKKILKGKIGKDIPEPSRVFSKQFSFIRCRTQHFWAVEQNRYSRFSFVENTIRNSLKVPRAQFQGNEGFFCFSSLCKFGSFKNPFATIISLSELYLN